MIGQLTPLRFSGGETYVLSDLDDPVQLEFDDGLQITVPPGTMVRLPDDNPLHLTMTVGEQTCGVTLSWPEHAEPSPPDNVVAPSKP
jgi:hypothetical protein